MADKPIESMLFAYLDGELTQGEQQHVRIRLENPAEAQEEFRRLQALQQATSELAFSPQPDERMDELEARLSVKAPRRIGWLFTVVGLVFWSMYATYLFVTSDMYWLRKSIIGSIVIGLLLVLLSIARQRMLEIPHGRCRGVKR